MQDDKTELAVATKPTVSSPISFGASGVQLTSLEDAFRFAKAIVSSGFAPRGMEKPESVLVALQWGAELGLTPMAALSNIAVVNGRPSLFGDAALALVRSSGQLESYAEEEIGEAGADESCQATKLRNDHLRREHGPNRIDRHQPDHRA